MRNFLRAACVSSVLFGANASASETWVCIVHAPPPEAGGVTVSETRGHDLITLTDNALVLTYGLSSTSPKRSYQLLLNNDVGAIGAFALATDSPPGIKITGLPPRQADAVVAQLNLPKTLVSASIVALNKRDHTMREGVVGTWRVDQGQFGECQPQASEGITPGTNPDARESPH